MINEQEAVEAIRNMGEESLSPEKFENLLDVLRQLTVIRPALKEDYREMFVIEISKGLDVLCIEAVHEIEKSFDKILAPYGFTRISSKKAGDHLKISFGQFAVCQKK